MLKKIVVTLLFVLGIIVFGEVPHSYIWENPDKEVTQTETLKRYKDKAELNISITKLKSEPIPMKHDVDNKKIYFELTSEEVKRSDENIKLESTDRIFISEKLEEVPSVSTTNGRKKINGLKRLNKSLDKGTLKNGNLTWTVKDLMTVETKKIVEINYGMFPKSLYVGITDKDYNLKKIFVGKMESLELYNANDLAGYVSKYDEDTQISNQYDHDISDILMWGKNKAYVDIKLTEIEIASIANKTLIDKKPYLAVSNQTVTLTGTITNETVTGTLHIIDRSVQPFSLVETAENLLSKVMVVMNLDGKTTRELKTAYYVRLNGDEFKKLKPDTYKVGGSVVYGHNGGINQMSVPNIILTGDIIAQPKKINIDFWVFGTDFTDKVNYIIDPRLNGTGNLKIRAQDEEAPLDNSVSAGNTDSVFDMTGRLAKFDYDDTTEVTIENISGFIPKVQNSGSFFSHKNRWAEGTIPGYKVRARVWTDFDGIEIDFEKTSALSIDNDGVRKFKVIHKHTKTGKIIQEITVNLYVNNVRIQDRTTYVNRRRSDINLPKVTQEQLPNYFKSKDRKGRSALDGRDDELFGEFGDKAGVIAQVVSKPGDFKHYFPIMTKGVYLTSTDIPNSSGKNTVLISNNEQYITQIAGNKGTYQGDWFVSETASNGLSTIIAKHNIQKPIALVPIINGVWVYNYYLDKTKSDSYLVYGAGKRKIDVDFHIRVINWQNIKSNISSRTTTIEGVPLIGNENTGYNHFFGDLAYTSTEESGKPLYDNVGWLKDGWSYSAFQNAQIKLIMNGATSTILKETIPGNLAGYENFLYKNDYFFLKRRKQSKHTFLELGMGLKRWHTSHADTVIAKLETSSGQSFIPNQGLEYYGTNYTILIKKFDARFLWDKGHSSLKEGVLKNIDMDFSPNASIKGQIIKMGEVYFRHLNLEALYQNIERNNKPKFVLPNTTYIILKDGSQPNLKIPVELSFSESDAKIKAFEMQDKGGNYAGENGMTVYLHIDENSAKQIYKNGVGKRYQVKGSYVNNKYGVLNQNDTTEVVKIGVVCTKSPILSGSRNEPFFNTVTNNMVLETTQFKPNTFSINFLRNQPLIKNDFYMLGHTVKFVNPPSGYNYEQGITLSGAEVARYPYEIKQHRYQLTDETGRMHSGEISSGGSGAYWENLLVDNKRRNNKVTLYHTRDGQANREATFMRIEEWDYEPSSGKITKKHYNPYSTTVNTYYDITVNFPAFDPYIYYAEAKSIDAKYPPIKLRDTFEIQRYAHKYMYPLGTVSTKGYDVAITKKSGGDLDDTFGLRVVPNNRKDINGVKIYELNTNGEVVKEHQSKGRIILLDSKGFELPYSIDSPAYMLGANQSARIALELPKDLAAGKDYKIVGETDKILDKGNNIPNSFNLAIGRNKYFKEIIKEIYLKKEKIEGSFTLKFTNGYTIRTMAKFKSTTLSEREKISLAEPVQGVELLDGGEGFLQLENGDKFQIQVGEEIITLDIPSTLEVDKKEILLGDGMTKMALKIKDGKVQIGLNYWKPNSENIIIFRVIRNNYEAMVQTMKLITPLSQFIVTHKEDLDFGNVFQGTKNNYAEAKLEIENTGDIAEVKFEISDTTPTLENINDDTKTLEVREINGALFQKEPNKYEMRVNGFLDVPEKATIGEYKGSIIIKLYIK